mmetsp:Transcript_7913/g.11223  ORF Transcript_7913/g.11223 Transcript_7913/m.11223 type:complete len:242 (-) Transcript_7913:549-1274(-)
MLRVLGASSRLWALSLPFTKIVSKRVRRLFSFLFSCASCCSLEELSAELGFLSELLSSESERGVLLLRRDDLFSSRRASLSWERVYNFLSKAPIDVSKLSRTQFSRLPTFPLFGDFTSMPVWSWKFAIGVWRAEKEEYAEPALSPWASGEREVCITRFGGLSVVVDSCIGWRETIGDLSNMGTWIGRGGGGEIPFCARSCRSCWFSSLSCFTASLSWFVSWSLKLMFWTGLFRMFFARVAY